MAGEAGQDPDRAQARVLCEALRDSLREAVGELAKLEHADSRQAVVFRRRAAELRCEIDRVKFLIARLHRRFPSIAENVADSARTG
ncbi:hypothetical protein [Micromonospora sp. WMMD736]|uniref:hypothetical protein n=1 Tax=Micromonospora sp. WMMD736 TaxID=3404112 RepID=UPI003B946B1E